MLNFSKEDQRALCRRYNDNIREGMDGFEGFSKCEKLGLAMHLAEGMNKDSKLQSVRESWSKWNQLKRDLIVELLSEFEEVPTNKGMRSIIVINGNTFTLCKHCGGTAVNYQRKNNKCDCIIGYRLHNGIKQISHEEYKIRATNKYLNKLRKARKLSKYEFDELVAMDLEEFLKFTKITAL